MEEEKVAMLLQSISGWKLYSKTERTLSLKNNILTWDTLKNVIEEEKVAMIWFRIQIFRWESITFEHGKI